MTWTLSWPYAISFSFNFDDEADIETTGYKPYDYACWNVVDNWGNLDYEKFSPNTVWQSLGTKAEMNIRVKQEFFTEYDLESTYKKMNVYYNY